MRQPGKLKADEQSHLKALLDRCPELNALAGHVRAFAEMIRELRGERLHKWRDDVQADDLPELHSFVAGLRRDQDAVVAGVTLCWSSGPAVQGLSPQLLLQRHLSATRFPRPSPTVPWSQPHCGPATRMPSTFSTNASAAVRGFSTNSACEDCHRFARRLGIAVSCPELRRTDPAR